jgi:phosphatidylglycerophosphatase A
LIGGGFGIMADDILAGIFTGIIVNLGILIL